MLMAGLMLFVHSGKQRAIKHRGLMSGCRLPVLAAEGHRNRVQILQRQAGDQQEQSECFQEPFHADILKAYGRALQAWGTGRSCINWCFGRPRPIVPFGSVMKGAAATIDR